jgi:hypothetical protein
VRETGIAAGWSPSDAKGSRVARARSAAGELAAGGLVAGEKVGSKGRCIGDLSGSDEHCEVGATAKDRESSALHACLLFAP